MNRPFPPELSRTINRQAYMLAQQSFADIRANLEKTARAMLQEGKSPDEALDAMRSMNLRVSAMRETADA